METKEPKCAMTLRQNHPDLRIKLTLSRRDMATTKAPNPDRRSFLLGSLAALTYWLDAQVQGPSDRRDGSTRHDPDVFLENFRAITYDASGRPRDKENISRRVLGPTVKRANELRAERDLPPLPKVTPHALRRTYIKPPARTTSSGRPIRRTIVRQKNWLASLIGWMRLTSRIVRIALTTSMSRQFPGLKPCRHMITSVRIERTAMRKKRLSVSR